MKKEKTFTPLEISGEKISKIKKRRFLKGFTLIELLLVISIIGLLSSIVLVATKGVSAKARDAKREIEVASVAKALEIYFFENENYPVLTGWTSLEEDFDTNGIFSQEMEGFLTAMPRDPSYGQTSSGGEPYSYQYLSSTGGEYYAVKVVYEKKGSGGTEKIVTVYSSPEGEAVLGGGGSSTQDLAIALDNDEQLMSYGIVTGGDAPFEVSTEHFCVGNNSAKTGCITSGQISYLEFQIDVDSVIFYTSWAAIDNPNDVIYIKENGQIRSTNYLGGACGTIGYGTLSAGSVIRVEYVNNSAVPDCIYLDNLRFKPPQ